ncbi:2-dehydropantoate 2-reductase [Enterococcus sp. PF1-24]|uniref:ketopantoate reductase family protein n=1 Tax=unclassified Enterococcus TaxID=2608891 RepID=UPI0024761B34|nr:MULTISPECIES: 2-dehydropantoate 2-reductase N-terminal domain-containing protein [unclassified Enterococcus]MDH6364331.1 2-dehydropantoate 2-reductase [Enterococcus sp. PFB1-1]MDH6401480.1 2-dehydropantoate 2-reductase [Enterococcus sp. PF1-24]
MKILIYGAGIQGSYLAYALNKNKQNEVFVLARNKRKEILDQQGLKLAHIIQRKTTTDHLKTVATLKKFDYCDLIFVTMKYNDFPTIIEPIAENNSKNIVFVGNQMDTEDLKAKILAINPDKNILFGFQNTGGTREPDLIKILRFNQGKMKINCPAEDVKTKQLFDDCFANTGYKWLAYPALDQWLKSHAALIVVMNSLDYYYGNDLKQIRKANELLLVTGKAYQEIFAILEDNGYPILPKAQKRLFSNAHVTKFLFKMIYATPIMQSAEGDYGEIKGLADSFAKFKMQSGTPAPNLDHLVALATKKYLASKAAV